MMRVSRPVLTPAEIEAQIRAENNGQPVTWVDERVNAELAGLKAREVAAQEAYDKTPPARAYTPPGEG